MLPATKTFAPFKVFRAKKKQKQKTKTKTKTKKKQKKTKLKFIAKNKTRTTLRITKKNFQDEELSHELFLITRQKNRNKNFLC